MELVEVRLQLKALNNAEIWPQYIAGLHAWFLKQVQRTNPEFSQYLHDGQSEKPFTISGLEEFNFDSAPGTLITENQVYSWTITGLNPQVVQWLQEWIKNPPASLKLRPISFEIVSMNETHPPITYQSLLRTPVEKLLQLSFVSPTSFRRKGHHFPLPLPFNVFQSYLRRWNDFANYPIDTESFLQWVDNHVVISRHQLQTFKVAGGKRGMVTGFVGAIEYSLSTQGRKNKEFTQLFFALGKLAPYSGTGHKTTFGLGQTRCEWLPNNQIQESIESGISMSQRIKEITNSLMRSQKRTGGKRALKVCQTRAIILARQEQGESLTDIAQDLEMAYETVKTYAKLARKLLHKKG